MKQVTRRCSGLVMTLMIGGLIMSACSLSRSGGNATDNAASGTAQQAAENKSLNTTETSKTDSSKPIDIFSAFKTGADYKTDVRPKILKDGWQPARTEEGDDNCASGVKKCEEYPELEGGPAARMGNIVFRWKKGEKVLLIHTVDDPPVYTEYEFEKQSKLSNPSDLTGKYDLAVVGISGEHTLELRNDKTATLKILEEDGTTTGTGSWSWDETKRLLTVTFLIKHEIAGSDVTEEKPKTSKALFQFTREGSNLKIVNQTLALDVSYSGNLFKKL